MSLDKASDAEFEAEAERRRAARAAAAQQATAQSAGRPGFLKPGSFTHTYSWTEKSGLPFFLYLLSLQYGISMHDILHWQPVQYLSLLVYMVVATGWYPSAQSNAVQRAASSEAAVDPQFSNRDHTYSVLGFVAHVLVAVTTLIGAGLLAWTDVFDNPGWNGIVWAIRDRMIISPAALIAYIFYFWMLKVEVGNNNLTLTEIVQLAGRLLRFERTQH